MDWRAKLRETLEGAELDVQATGDELRVERPSGAAEDAVRVVPDSFLESLPDDREAARRAVAAYASGVRHVLLEPAGSDAHERDFPEVAGRLGLALHAAPFAAGVEAAAGSPPWSSPLTDDLHFVCLIELDLGTRVLTEDQFERWSATDDRVLSGARSMLFHKAETTSPQHLEGRAAVERLRVGDGYDAARILVLGDLMFGEFDDASRFAMPTTNDLYFVREGTPTAVDELREVVAERVEHSDYPLSPRLFRLERGRPRAVDGPGGGDETGGDP